MAYCTNCGTSIEAGGKFCPSCGHEVEDITGPGGEWIEKTGQFIMGKNTRTISLVLFVLAFLCLFLPFVTISCQGQNVATFSTMDMVAGISVGDETVGSNALAIFVLILILAGIVLYFWKDDLSHLASAGASLLCFLFLIILRVSISSKVSKGSGSEMNFDFLPSFDGISVKSRAGFYLLFILTLAGTVLNGYIVKKDNLLAKIRERR